MADVHEALPARRDLAVIGVLAALVLVPSLFTRDPWNPDEPRYAEVAREMVVRGDYLVPHLNGEPYPDKPPVFFWLAAAMWHAGLGASSGRVVALLATVGTLLLVYEIGRRWHDREVGLLAALITLTTGLFFYISKCGVLDPLLTLLAVVGIYCALRALEPGSTCPGRWWLGFYAAAALGILTKGPVGLAVPGLVVTGYALARRKHVRGGGWRHLAGALLMAALVAAWLVPAVLKGGPAYANDILFRQTAGRVVESYSHQKPFYFFLVWAPVCFLPWSLLLPLAFLWALRAARRGEPQHWLGVLWLAIVFLFFSAISGKRERYLLPMCPAVGLLCGQYVWAVARGASPWPRCHRWLWRGTLVLIAALAAALVTPALNPDALAARAEIDAEATKELRALVTFPIVAGATVAGIALVALSFCGARSPQGSQGERRRAGVLIAAIVVFSLAIDLVATPLLNQFKSGRHFALRAKAYLDAADEVFLLDESFSGVYNLFARRLRMPVLEGEAALKALSSTRRVAMIGREKNLRRLWPAAHEHTVARDRVGHRVIALVINWEPQPTQAPNP